ncbi:MAG TPA: alanine--tRNA ligase [Candidatus Methylomirabilis sp.]|nr:alanine--tRNA ligase [Candidatus Methylomirabilis sp.]
MATKVKSGNELRQAFVDYFKGHGHTHVESSLLVPKADPTLLFTNAGMVQFKDVFTGKEKRPYSRAVTVQKCVRAGGKHNDLENVGRTARHHTFFEMLGNFSFGDYFKEKAIDYGWEFLTGTLGLPADRLWVTIHEGDAGMGIGPDDEARSLWRRYVPDTRIVACSTKDNFWAMGDTGPCGPCSEIVFDQGPGMGCGRPTCAVGCDCDRYLELWNLVFMQFERSAEGTMTPLPRPSIDTGAGLERIAAILQRVPSNFDTDLLRPIISLVEELTGKRYGMDPAIDVSMRVIADHARATTFLVSDGVLPSNEGRGYVLRRILRRGLRHGRLLGLEDLFMATVTGRVVELMHGAYPELLEHRDYVARVTLNEEERFGHTLRVGLKMVESVIGDLLARRAEVIPGSEIFRLYDTYGFPLDLLRDIAAERGLSLDEAGFDREMADQRAKARESWVGSGEAEVPANLKELTAEMAPVEALWHTDLDAEALVVAILAGDGQRTVPALEEGQTGDVLLSRTPFYPEAGGQVGDVGTFSVDGTMVEVLDTRRPVPGIVLHRVRVKRGRLRTGASVHAVVDASRRKVTAKNHTATHLLHAALRQVLGDHVKQAGSLVAPDRLRFDFTHWSPLTDREVDRIEELVNEQVWENRSLHIESMDLDRALALGAMALFGEKYGERVRVVKVPEFSIELCGGIHVGATGEIGLFKIVSQGGVASGVRRIEACTGPGALRYVKQEEQVLTEAAERIKARPLELPEKVEKLTGAARELEREIQRLQGRLAAKDVETLLQRGQDIDGVKVVTARVDDLRDVKAMRELGDRLRERLKSGVVVLASGQGDRVTWVTMVTKDLTSKLHAGHLARELATATGGSGGGRPDVAEAGGKDPSRIGEALEKVHYLVRGQLSKK